AKLLAGGTALVLMLRNRLVAPRYLISLNTLPGLRDVAYQPGEGLRLGALATIAQAERAAAVREHYPALAETHHKVANIRVRWSEDRPCVGVAATLRLDAAGACEELRVVVGAVAGTPQRLPEAEASARGERPTPALFQQIGDAYARAVDPIDDARGSAWYRRR